MKLDANADVVLALLIFSINAFNLCSSNDEKNSTDETNDSTDKPVFNERDHHDMKYMLNDEPFGTIGPYETSFTSKMATISPVEYPIINDTSTNNRDDDYALIENMKSLHRQDLDKITLAYPDNDETTMIIDTNVDGDAVLKNTRSNASDVELSGPIVSDVETAIGTENSNFAVNAAETSTTGAKKQNESERNDAQIGESAKKYEFVVPGGDNVSCVLASMVVTFRVPYFSAIERRTKTKIIEMPKIIEVNGKCARNSSVMLLSWSKGVVYNDANSSVEFHIVNDGNVFYVNKIDVKIILNEEDFADAAEKMTTGSSDADLRLFSASLKEGVHVCKSATEVRCGKIDVTIKDVAFIAFNDERDVSYRKEKLCDPPTNKLLVTIVGSVAVVVILVIVIVMLIRCRPCE